MWELDYKERWVPKNWCFWSVVLEKTLESPLDCKEIQPVHPKGNQSWIFIGRTDAEAEAPILWPPDVKNWLIGKDPDAGNDWSWEEKGTAEDEMVGWHHRLDGHEFEQALGVGDGQGGLACCSPWGCKESDSTERPNWTELKSKWMVYVSWKDYDSTSSVMENNQGFIWNYPLWMWSSLEITTKIVGKGMKVLVAQITKSCDTCLQNNPRTMPPPPPLFRPIQYWGNNMENWQIDFTQVPKTREYKYLLVKVDTFTG